MLPLPSHEQLAYFITHPKDKEAAEQIVTSATEFERYVPGSALADVLRRNNSEFKNLSDSEVLRRSNK